MKKIMAGIMIALAGAAGSAMADEGDITRVKAEGAVDEVMNALEMAVEGAGATVFARVDHAGGAEKAGMYMEPSQLLIFGNPKLGTPAMQDNMLAGLYLPLKVLVYRDKDNQVWLAYEDPDETLDLDGIDDDAEYIKQMTGALEKLVAKASGM